MGKPGFKFGEKFGYESPLKGGLQASAKVGVVPTISFAIPVKNELPIEVKHELTFLVDGEYDWLGGEKFTVEIVNENQKSVSFSTSSWDKDGGVERGWKIKTKVKSSVEGKFSFYFLVGGKKSSAFSLNFFDPNKKTCPVDPAYRSHFVIHCTAASMSVDGIKSLTKYGTAKQARSKAHVYVLKDGTTLQLWPFTEKNVWATKAESLKGLKGQMFHVELNYGAPDAPTEEQYQTLANLYVEASNVDRCWPIIVPHIEVDRGIPNGHADPLDFDYNHFYEILKGKNVPIDKIPKFDHNRYWEKPAYKVPLKDDKYSWPPVLKGNPHK